MWEKWGRRPTDWRRKQGSGATQAEHKSEAEGHQVARKSQSAAERLQRHVARLTKGLMKEANKSHGDPPTPRPTALNTHSTDIDLVAAWMETFNFTPLWVFNEGAGVCGRACVCHQWPVCERKKRTFRLLSSDAASSSKTRKLKGRLHKSRNSLKPHNLQTGLKNVYNKMKFIVESSENYIFLLLASLTLAIMRQFFRKDRVVM